MHYFVAEVSQIEIGTVAMFLKRAEAIYEENLSAYVKIVLRRPFAKIIVRLFICFRRQPVANTWYRSTLRVWIVY